MRLARLTTVGVGGLAIGLIVITMSQRSLLYEPDNNRPMPGPGLLPASGTVLTLHTADGLELGAWFLRADASGREPGPAVLLFNGNAGDRSDRLDLAAALAERGYHVLLFDYRGYGRNPGSPSEVGLRADARAALAALRERSEVDPAQILYLGESLGAAVAVGLAGEEPPAALVLRSPFASVLDLARYHYPWLPVAELILFDHYPVVEQISRLEVPVLVIAARSDDLVPPEQSRAVAGAAPEAQWLQLPVDGHNDPFFSGEGAMVEAIDEFAGRELR